MRRKTANALYISRNSSGRGAFADGGIPIGNIEAWHQSPYSFDRFDIEKAKGARAFGHGLYFGKNKAAIEEMAQKAKALGKNPFIYKVKLNFPESKLVDWNKPISEQPKTVQDAFAPHLEEWKKQNPQWDDSGITGKDAYRILHSMYGFEGASNMLNKSGVPGIVYGPEDKRNYVAFNDKDIYILDRYSDQNADEKQEDRALSIARSARKDGGRALSYPLREKEDWSKHERFQSTGGKMTQMSPSAFLGQTEKMDMDKSDKKHIKKFKKKMRQGEKLNPLAIFPSGGQDGRHRAAAAKALGIAKVPVISWPGRSKS